VFDALARPGAGSLSGGVVWARGENKRTLLFAAHTVDAGKPRSSALYELDGELRLRKVDDQAAFRWLEQNVAVPRDVLAVDAASVVYTDDAGKRWRLPKGDAAFDEPGPLGPARVSREVSTERDLFNAHGTFYELPAENAGGVAFIRPVATHNRRIHDYCSYRGLTVISGLRADAGASEHVVRSDDGKVALWVGVSDDLWRLGKPRGRGGPWLRTKVVAGVASDPYLMAGYDRKTVTLRHDAAAAVQIRLEVDLTGTGVWVTYRDFTVEPGPGVVHQFPADYAAYWLRVAASRGCTATATLDYA
jgi:hypothetical protein